MVVVACTALVLNGCSNRSNPGPLSRDRKSGHTLIRQPVSRIRLHILIDVTLAQYHPVIVNELLVNRRGLGAGYGERPRPRFRRSSWSRGLVACRPIPASASG